MKIIWNKVTPFSQIVAIALFLIVFGVGYYIGYSCGYTDGSVTIAEETI
jgi:hypothetical protein